MYVVKASTDFFHETLSTENYTAPDLEYFVRSAQF